MDEEQPSFKVVDRRASSRETQADVAPPDTDTTPPSGNVESEFAQEHAESDGEQRGPSADMLLGYVGAQMETNDLVAALIGVFDAKAWMHMGLVANPLTGQSGVDLVAAKLAIDCVQFLLSKIESDLPAGDRRDAQRRLSDLRINYVNKSSEASV